VRKFLLRLLRGVPIEERSVVHLDQDDYKDALRELVYLDAEAAAIRGGLPGFQRRWDKAWDDARELFQP
jgi:hypothetical protein